MQNIVHMYGYHMLPYTFLVSQVIYRVILVVHKAQSYGHYQMLIILHFT